MRNDLDRELLRKIIDQNEKIIYLVGAGISMDLRR